MRACTWVIATALAAQTPADLEQRTESMRAQFARVPKLDLKPLPRQIEAVGEGFISWVARAGEGAIFVLQRGDRIDPVVVIDDAGKVLRSWGKGLFTIPHSIRLDPDGNVWTVDAGNSKVFKFSAAGTRLLEIQVELPAVDRQFRGATDIAFGCGGRIYVADGYANNRVLMFGKDGRRLGEWGTAGKGQGQFNLPHAIATNGRDTMYVADRQNSRIQRFDCEGKYMGEWSNIGSPFSLRYSGGFLWVSSFAGPGGKVGWIHKIDAKTGKTLGQFETVAHHGLEVTVGGQILAPSQNRLFLYR